MNGWFHLCDNIFVTEMLNSWKSTVWFTFNVQYLCSEISWSLHVRGMRNEKENLMFWVKAGPSHLNGVALLFLEQKIDKPFTSQKWKSYFVQGWRQDLPNRGPSSGPYGGVATQSPMEGNEFALMMSNVKFLAQEGHQKYFGFFFKKFKNLGVLLKKLWNIWIFNILRKVGKFWVFIEKSVFLKSQFRQIVGAADFHQDYIFYHMH